MSTIAKVAALWVALYVFVLWARVMVLCAYDAFAPEPARQPRDFQRINAVDRCLAERGRPRTRYQEGTPAWTT